MQDVNLRIMDINGYLRRLCSDEGIEYIDLHKHFLDERGGLSRAYSLDGSHLNGAGYRLWKELIEEKL